jgi:tetratricopeptide (TPR) repeat protein
MKHRIILVAVAVCSVFVLGRTNLAANFQGEKTALDYLREGSVYYLKHDFKKAIPPYQKALDLEKENSTLEKTLWKVLVDNLGMSYGITGNLKKAKEIFEYGISKDPHYPLFYYNMACTYGEMKDMDKAIEYLRLAFERKKNVIEGEHMPDPATDSSFERFMKDEKFLNALKEIKQQ